MSDKFCKGLTLVHESGDILWPVRMMNRDTGEQTFRASPGGNTKEVHIETIDRHEIIELAMDGKAIRCATLNGKRSGLYRLDGRSIVSFELH